MIETLIEVPEEFSLARTVQALGVGSFDHDHVWWWATTAGGSVSAYAVDTTGDGIRVRCWGDAMPVQPDRLLGLDDDPSATPGPPWLRRRMRGLHLGATNDVHGASVKAVLAQKVTTTEAHAAMARLTGLWGATPPVDRPGLVAIPPPDVLSSLTPADLHSIGVERARASTLIEVSRRSARLEEILVMDRDAAYRRLTAISGIGPWSAAMVMGVAWGDRDAVLVGDFHLPNTVAWALAGEDRATDDRMLELLGPYRPHRRRVLMALKQTGAHAPRYGPRSAVRRHL